MSKLNTLLGYRFVRKKADKLQHHDSGSSSSPNSGSDTQPPSSQEQIWDKPSSTTIKDPLYPQYGGSGISDASQRSDVSVIPETPLSSLPSSGSPVFKHKVSAGKTNVIEDSEEAGSSHDPWLSKEQGKIMNGNIKSSNKKPETAFQNIGFAHLEDGVISVSDSSDSELPDKDSNHGNHKPDKDSNHGNHEPDKDSNHKLNHSGDFPGKLMKLVSLKQMFPTHSESDVKQALLDAEEDMDTAIDVLIYGPSRLESKSKIKELPKKKEEVQKKKRKRIRVVSDSSDNDDAPHPKPHKRIRQITSSSTEGQDTPNVQSPQANDPELDDETRNERIDFLSDAFPGQSRQELSKLLEKNSWSVDDATVELSTNQSTAVVKKENVSDAEDDDDDYESDGYPDSDDSIEAGEGGEGALSQKEIMLSFFEDASFEELMSNPGCSKKKAELIVSLRPYGSWETLVQKFCETKGLSYDVITGHKEIIRVRAVVTRLMERCEKISQQMKNVVHHLMQDVDLEDSDQIRKQPSVLNVNLQMKAYQLVGLNWLRVMHTQNLNGILADEMGLGKTIQSIAFLAHLMEEGEDGTNVIIVPSSTIDNWRRELQVWCPALKVLVYYGSQEDRRMSRQCLLYEESNEFDVILTTYNMATGSVEDRSLFKKYAFHYAIFDEGHMLKNMSSLRFQNLMKIRAERRLLLTGTPLQNNLIELMSLLCFVMPDMFSGKTEQLRKMFTFFYKTGADGQRSQYESERIAHAKRIMAPFVLRRLKSEVLQQLPKKVEIIKNCTLIPDQQELYDHLIANFTEQLEDTEGEDVASKPSGGAAMLMQLRKCANHPLLHRSRYNDKKLRELAAKIAKEPSHLDRGALPKLIFEDMAVLNDFDIHRLCLQYKKYIGKYRLDDSVIADSGKFRMLDSLLEEMKEKGDRVLLFSQFTMMMDIIEEFLNQKNYRFIRLDGSTPVPERQKLIDDFTMDKEIFVFLLSTRAGGLGINLTAANRVILHDIDFNPYNDKQAEDRCHRVGQNRDVTVIKLISKDTVEDAMLRCAREKLKLEKDITGTEKVEDEENPKDVVSLLKQALLKTKT